MERVKNCGLVCDKALINGRWVDARAGATFPVLNPADGTTVCSVPDMKADDVQDAVNAAHEAFRSWKKTSAQERSELIRKWVSLINKHKEDLAAVETAEQGKPTAQATEEVSAAASTAQWFAEESIRNYGDVIPSPASDRRLVVIKQPVGVAGLITPWNFPIALISRKVAPALAAGCTVVIKPSEETPLTALAMCKLSMEAGFPPGVINVVTCSRANVVEVGGFLCRTPLIGAISFTGSTFVGKKLLEMSANTVKKMSMELGGNAPFIVFNSADVQAAAQACAKLKFSNAGQICVAPNRVLVQAGVYEEFVAAMEKMVSGVKMGSGFLPDSIMGPLINEAAVHKVDTLVQEARSRGARVLTGGRPAQGCFYPPTLLTDVTTHMRCAQEEIFGPVAAVLKFETEEEALAISNSVGVGLASYFFTRDMAQSWRVAEALEVGMVGVNDTAIKYVNAPFGGVKESGLGRESGKHGMEEFLEVKTICFGGLDS